VREWNTPVREPWNPVIQQCLKGVDEHVRQYIRTGNVWHLEKAAFLRTYVKELKVWIHKMEGREKV
jgi:hypothetical protein